VNFNTPKASTPNFSNTPRFNLVYLELVCLDCVVDVLQNRTSINQKTEIRKNTILTVFETLKQRNIDAL